MKSDAMCELGQCFNWHGWAVRFTDHHNGGSVVRRLCYEHMMLASELHKAGLATVEAMATSIKPE